MAELNQEDQPIIEFHKFRLISIVPLIIMMSSCRDNNTQSLEDKVSVGDFMAQSNDLSWYAPMYASIIDASRSYYRKHNQAPKSLNDMFPGNVVPIIISTERGNKVVELNKNDIKSKCEVREHGTILHIKFKFKDSIWMENEIDVTLKE